jgi:hypothetical protein
MPRSENEWREPPPVRQKERAILHNVTSIRSFSETEWKKNLGVGFLKTETVYLLLSDVIKSFCFAKQNIVWGYFFTLN